MRSGRLPLVITGAALGAVLATAGVVRLTAAEPGGAPTTDGPRVLAAGETPMVTGPGALDRADSCADLLAWYVARAESHVGPWGWDSPMVTMSGAVRDMAADGFGEAGSMRVDAPQAAPAPAPEAAESSETGTNVQEAGVDEPDVVKTDGSLLVRVEDGDLTTYDVTGAAPTRLGSLDLAGVRDPELLLTGDRVVVLGHDLGSRLDHPRTIVVTVDVSDPARPVVADRDEITADLVAARRHGDAVRLVLSRALPPLRFVGPGPLRSQGAALRANEAIIRRTTLDDWLPQVTDEDGTTERLLECEDVHLPDDKRAGFGTLAVVAFDPASPDVREAEGIATDSRTAYLSVDRLYVAETTWPGFGWWREPPVLLEQPMLVPDPVEPRTVPPEEPRPIPEPEPAIPVEPRIWPMDDGVTRLHSFALGGLATTYVASGEVDGRIADRWAMDEADGVVRLALGPTQATGSFNSVVTLAEEGDELVEVGRVDRLGVDEEIKSVRWFDDLAIVVTFRQTDPLYAIDLADPTRPRLLGELKIPGFSEYLHPLDSRWMLGLGQDATLNGVTRGAQAALFDLADLAAPERVAVVGYGKATQAMAAWDPRQFTWLPEQRTALTVVADEWSGRGGWVSVLRVDDDSLDNRMVELSGEDLTQVRLVPLPSGKVVLVTGDEVSFFTV